MLHRHRRRPPRSRRIGLRGVLAFLFVAIAAVAAGYAGFRLLRREPPVAAKTRAGGTSRPPVHHVAQVPITEPEPSGEGPPGEAAPPPIPTAPRVLPVPPGGARIALVLDDLGRSVRQAETLEALGAPLSYAVLPFEAQTTAVVEELHRHRAEILLHLPMAAEHGANPGPGALTLAMSDAELAAATRAALAAVPGAVGVNNHMGSALTADDRAMRAVLGVLAEDGLFFVDSRTTAETVAYRVAAALDVAAAERQVFLDPDPRPDAVRYQFARLLELARRRGSAIAIGHPHPATIEVLREEIPRARSLGYELVPVSYLLNRTELPM